MGKTRRKLSEVLQFFRPQNLQRQIDSYGYHFSMEKYAVSVAGAAAAACMCGMLFSLRWYWTMLVAAAGLLCLPGLLVDGYKNMYEHKRFLDLSDYMEQMLYSFRLNQKILVSLKDTATLFSGGRMKQAIEEAAAYIEAGSYKKDLYREALECIERVYPNQRLTAIHSFLWTVESNGGDCEASIRLLLEDKDIWADNILLLQEEKKAARTRVLFALVITVGLALLFHSVYRSMPQQYSIVANPVTQAATAAFLCLSILTFRQSSKEIAKSWIQREENAEEDKMRRYLKLLETYEEKTERRKSFLWALPFLAGAIVTAALGHPFGCAGMGAVGLLVMNQHKIGRSIAYGRVAKEINTRFPQWLMELALLLQGNNVQVAMEKTIPQAPMVLRGELEKLQNGLKKHPGSLEPYMGFLSMFGLSTVQSAMKMLYAVSEAGSGDTQSQIQVMVQRNHKLLDKSEKLLNEKNMTKISTLFYLPQLTISFQMMANMVVFMMVFLSQMKLA